MTVRLNLFALAAVLFACLAGSARAQNVYISEFMASNARALADETGAYPDWLELYNSESTSVNLDGWYLTQNPSVLNKWRIPAVTLPPYGFLVIFCDKLNKAVAGSPLHTNFKLSASGDFLALVKPDGSTIACQYAPMYPPQQTDVSYGMAFSGPPTTLIAPGAPARAIVPTDDSLGTTWMAPSFDDSAWKSGTTAVGYERASGYESYIGLDLGPQMYTINCTAYIRIPFNIPDAAALDKLTLRMKVDDGFIAYFNGTQIASFNAPASPAWNSTATANYDDSLAVIYQDFDVSSFKSALHTGTNVLDIQGLNVNLTSSDFLILPELLASSGTTISPTILQYFSTPTPGAPNGTGTSDQGPIVSQVSHAPSQPSAGQSLQVTARIVPRSSPLATTTLNYRVNYGTIVAAPLYDDGAHGDGDAGDGVYGATIPSTAYSAGQMVRYYVSATDNAGHTGRYPLFANPTQSPEYQGTMVADPSVTSQLPVFYWFLENPGAAATDAGTQCSVFYNGVLYDNVEAHLRGQTSAGWPKPHFNFNMNSGYEFVRDPAKPTVQGFDLQSTFSDKSYMRAILAWETYENAGVPGCEMYSVRVQQNGAFYSVASILEQPDSTMLTRNGLDADGAFYKMYSDASTADGAEKETRKNEDNSDLVAFVAGLPNTGSALTNFLFDNLDVPEAINYWAATTIMHDNDQAGKNYYLYRDTDGNSEWSVLPWDKDLTFGRNFTNEGGVLNDTIWANVDPMSHPLFGDQQHPKCDGPWNRIQDAMSREPTIRQMYLRRLRTVMDALLQPPGTPAAQLKFENHINAMGTKMNADVILDKAKWGNPYGVDQGFATAVNIMKNSYLAVRRVHLYTTHSTVDGLIPQPNTGFAPVQFGAMDPRPASGNQSEEYLTLINTGSTAVDISGYSLSGDVAYQFAPGVVIPAHGTLYVAGQVKAFRARTTPPTGGQGLFVVGGYHGHLKATGGVVGLFDASGVQIAASANTVDDVKSALQMAAGVTAADSSSVYRFDRGQNGSLDVGDAVALLRRVAGIDP